MFPARLGEVRCLTTPPASEANVSYDGELARRLDRAPRPAGRHRRRTGTLAVWWGAVRAGRRGRGVSRSRNRLGAGVVVRREGGALVADAAGGALPFTDEAGGALPPTDEEA
ncbi:hypothetical protein NWFMUON74_47250 [Nocardia wallacei]|uniref:Uncharacterized protein n=1 Tax=Nocardia wallacei TaxID=480035 RepID=A0A7G1KRV2_9NOCA|nr:hypothetical protein NWFMUON74_47250 [Nocardia wallacei]